MRGPADGLVEVRVEIPRGGRSGHQRIMTWSTPSRRQQWPKKQRGHFFDECSIPVLVKDIKLGGWDAAGDTARTSIHGVGWADRSNPGCSVDPTGAVDHGGN